MLSGVGQRVWPLESEEQIQKVYQMTVGNHGISLHLIK